MAPPRIAVGIGLMAFPFSTMAAFWRWVDLCEAGGLDSIWHSDRLVSRTPILEVMSLMAALAGATRRIKFGMNVVSLGLRDPLVLAKQCATIDFMSEGRLLPAFGVGSPVSPDWAATGRSARGAGGRVDEALEIMARLWRGEQVDLDGQHHRYRGAHIAPLPVQQPLPLWFGGASPASVRRTARHANGWLGGPETPAEAAAVVAAIEAACAAEGTRIPADHFGTGFFFRLGAPADAAVVRHLEQARARNPGRDPARTLVAGSVDDLMARLGDYADVGVSKFVLRPVGADDADLMAQTRALVEQVLPAVAALNAARMGATQPRAGRGSRPPQGE